MRRELVVAFAVVASVLVATAPVAGSHQLATASIHTTDTDFNAGSLTNMTVNGSGDSATVELEDAELLNDSFADIDGYTNVSINADADWTVTANDAVKAEMLSSGQAALINDSLTVRDPTVEVQNITHGGGTTNEQPGVVISWQDSDNFVRVRLNKFEDNFTIRESVGGTETTVSTVNFDFQDDTPYNLVVEKDGQTVNATVFNQTGSQLVTTEGTIDASLDTSAQVGLSAAGAGSGTPTMFWSDLVVRVPPETAEYIGANHTAENTEQGFVNITEITNATATVTWETNDGSGWSTLNETSSITSAANHTFTWAVESNDTIRVNVTVFNESGNGEPAFTMADEGVQFTAAEPTVDNSSATPTGDLDTDEPTLKIDVNDSDFPLAQSDTLTVEFFVDGSSEGTDTLNSNDTAELQVGPLDGGDHNWSVTVTDEHGHSVDSQTFDITVPANLTIRTERPVHDIIDDREIEVTFYEQTNTNPTIVNKTTTDGNVSLEGLPVGSEFTVVITTDGYYNRTILVDDIFTQSDVFLLNTSADVANVTFDISDPVGEFSGEETEIVVKRAINESLYNDSGGFSFMAVEGDEIGAAGEIRTTLQVDQRYQLEVRNDEETRVLGGYTAEVDDAHTLRPSVPDVNVTDEQGYAWNASTDAEANTITFEFLDPDDNTTDLELVIYEQNNASNELYNQTHDGPHGFLRVTQMLTNEQANKTWAVNYSATREGNEIGGERAVGRKVITQLPQLDSKWKHAVAVIITIMTGALFSVRNAETGAITTSFVGGGFWMGGWLPTEAGGAIMVALFVAVIYKTQAGRFG